MATDQILICQTGGGVGLERTRFFPRQLVTPDDLTQDQIYFREKTRRHNRLLHGWGVVCGARVMMHPTEKCKVIIEAGYVLGPYGDEIVLDSEVTVDLCREGMDGNAVSPCGDQLDPWCSDVRVGRQPGQPLYVAVRYAECQARPVRAQGNGCGCSEAECEYSRTRDSYAIKVLTSLPSTYTDPMPQPDSEDVVRCATDAQGNAKGRSCPDCPTEPWVILADVVPAADGSVGQIDCFAHRRYVVSFADYYFLCRPRTTRPTIDGKILIDRTAERAGEEAAPVLVRAKRVDGTVAYIPAQFKVNAGETYATLLAREGTREFYDPTTNGTITLAELYALAGVDPTAPVRNVTDAVTSLEGLTLRVSDLRSTRTQLGDHLEASGLQRLTTEHADAPGAVEKLPATDIKGVSPRSPLARNLANLTIGGVANLGRDAFVEQALASVAERQRAAAETQARAVWDNAIRVVALTRGFKGQG